jgi:DNA gyrase subunit A
MEDLRVELNRPDLTGIPKSVLEYIEFLESMVELNRRSTTNPEEQITKPFEESEPPTSINIITASNNGWIKRTPRHKYNRQKRGGMGVFDIELQNDDNPAFLAATDENNRLLIITNFARAFHLPLSKLNDSDVRSRGQLWSESGALHPDEKIAAMIPNPASGYLVVISENGYVRRLRHHLFGEFMKPGTSLLDLKATGLVVAAGISSGEADILIATASGTAIRFPEKAIPAMGCLGIRLREDDIPVAVCGVKESSGVFFLGADGLGTIRLMSGFSVNKAPGSGGKVGFKTNRLVTAVVVSETEDLFIISKLNKIIRFAAIDVPPKEGVVQGVSCMSLRADECVTAITGGKQISK